MGTKIQQPLVSIIVPSYNYAVYLRECLESVLAQTFSRWECIIADNCSTDNTKEIVEEYVSKDSRFIYVYCEKQGVSAARNKAILNSSGMYILPLDADDKIGADYLHHAVPILQERNNVKIVYCEAELFGDVSQKWNIPEYSLAQMLKQNLIFCSGLYRRSDYEQTKGYNEAFIQGYEDWDFWLSLLESGGDVIRLKEVLFYYRIHQSSRNNSLDLEKQKLLRRLIYESHKELYDRLLNIGDLIFENYILGNNYNSIINSIDYKSMHWVFAPLRKLKFIIRKHKDCY